MLIKTRGIVLNYLKYRETSIIARIYTEQRGVQSYIVNGVRKAKPPGRIALFQPFTLLDMVAYVSPRGGLTRLSEYRCIRPFRSIPFDMHKSSVVLFLSEVVSRTLREEEENQELFAFLYNAIVQYDELASDYENFALLFLLSLAGYLGFSPDSGSQITEQVAFATDIAQASTTRATVLRFQEFEQHFDDLLYRPNETKIPSGRVRRELLEILLRYYQLHVEGLGDIRSLDVLSEVLAE